MAPHREPDPNPLTDNGQGMPPNPSHLNELHDNATIVPPPPPFPNNCAAVQNIQPPTSKGQNSIALEDVSADDATEENEDNFIPPPEFLTKMKSVESLSIEDAMNKAIRVVIDGQNPNGGYWYNYATKGPTNLSNASFNYQALKAAYTAGSDANGLKAAIFCGFFMPVRQSILRLQIPRLF